ncbi:MAG: hypothetical protein JSW63_08670 [Ignavibacterium sp.]|nr:MAG: hypothetical protein JSW63_08670 [Ignavibacterium sp.]
MKKIFLCFLLLFSLNVFAADPPASKATGIFLAFGVGPRLPVGDFSNTSELGYGIGIEVSYTDNEFLPVFLFASVGFEQYPGAQRFYQESAYSNLSTNSIPLNVGVRYYFSPLLEQIVLLIPLIEVSASFTYFQVLHEFKIDSDLSNFKTETIKYGITAGAGISMFLMEIIAAYHYVQNNQFVSFDLRVRIPLFVNL